MIAAMAKNHAIGKDNRLLWRIPADMSWFLEETRGQVLVCGRKTLESIKTLWQENSYIVLTRDKTYQPPAPNVRLIYDMSQIPKQDDAGRNIYICGGAEIYRACLPFCERLYLTTVKKEYEGDAFFPQYSDYFALQETHYEDEEIIIQFFKRKKP